MTAAERAEMAALRERADMHDAKIAALFGAMRHACEYAGIYVADDEQPPLALIPGSLVMRLDAMERGLTNAYQAAHWPAGDEPTPKRDRHGLRALPGGES